MERVDKMISIKTPDKYISEENILKNAGELIKQIGDYALVIGGETALSVTGEKFLNSLDLEKIRYSIEKFRGYCTYKNIDNYALKAKELGVNVIIGIGGGRVLDLVKAVGEKLKLPVITIPTIVATCAAWSALSVIYDDEGRHKDFLLLENSPKLILADIKIIYDSPRRYLHAGIGDTIVKWYEAFPHKTVKKDITLRIGLQTSKLALDILENYTDLIEKSEEVPLDEKFRDVVDSIIVLAGLVGSINGGNHIAAIAHTLHDSLTHILDTRETLHGEKVAFGLIVQFILEGRDEEEVKKLIKRLNILQIPITLVQLGIKDDIDNKVLNIIDNINFTTEQKNDLIFKVDGGLIKEAIIKADEFGNEVLEA